MPEQFRAPDFFDGVHSFDDPAKNRIAVAVGFGIVEGRIVDHVDKKLAGRGVRISRAGHGNCALDVFQAILGFKFDS